MAIHVFVNFDIFKWLYLAYYWGAGMQVEKSIFNSELVYLALRLAQIALRLA